MFISSYLGPDLCDYFVTIHGHHKIRGIRDASSTIFLFENRLFMIDIGQSPDRDWENPFALVCSGPIQLSHMATCNIVNLTRTWANLVALKTDISQE